MKVVNIEHRDIHIELDFSLYELTMLRNILNHAQINYDGESNPELVEADKFLTEKFYPFLERLIQSSESK